jgi:hypothetical protein
MNTESNCKRTLVRDFWNLSTNAVTRGLIEGEKRAKNSCGTQNNCYHAEKHLPLMGRFSMIKGSLDHNAPDRKMHYPNEIASGRCRPSTAILLRPYLVKRRHATS